MKLLNFLNKKDTKTYLKKEDLEKYQQFLKEWKQILLLNSSEIVTAKKESNIKFLDEKRQEWDGYHPISTSLCYGLITKEYKFLETEIKDKLKYLLIGVLDEERFNSKGNCYKIEDVKLYSALEYNNLINKDIDELKKAISTATNLIEEQFETVIINNNQKKIYLGRESINKIDIPQAKPEDLVIRVYYDKSFNSYEILIISPNKITDVFFWSSD